MSDVVFYCNKVINKYIFRIIITGILSSIFMIIVSGIVLFLLCALLSEYYNLFDLGNACTILLYIMAVAFIILSIVFTQFELRVLFDLKRFIDKEKINLKANNRIDIVVGTLDNLCNNLFRDRYTIEALSREVYRFKKLKLPKEDR